MPSFASMQRARYAKKQKRSSGGGSSRSGATLSAREQDIREKAGLSVAEYQSLEAGSKAALEKAYSSGSLTTTKEARSSSRWKLPSGEVTDFAGAQEYRKAESERVRKEQASQLIGIAQSYNARRATARNGQVTVSGQLPIKTAMGNYYRSPSGLTPVSKEQTEKRELYAAVGAPAQTYALGRISGTEREPIVSVSTRTTREAGMFRQGTRQDTVTIFPQSKAQSVLFTSVYGGRDKASPFVQSFSYDLPERKFKSDFRTGFDTPITTSIRGYQGVPNSIDRTAGALTGTGVMLGSGYFVFGKVAKYTYALGGVIKKPLIKAVVQGTTRFGLGTARGVTLYRGVKDFFTGGAQAFNSRYTVITESDAYRGAVAKTNQESSFGEKWLKPRTYNERLRSNLGLYGVGGGEAYTFGLAEQRVIIPVSVAAGAVGFETAGEGAGRAITPQVVKFFGGTSKVATYGFTKRFLIYSSGSAIGGFGEGFGGSIGADLISGQRVSYTRALKSGAAGSFIAGSLGGLIGVTTAARTPAGRLVNRPAGGLEVIGYGIDAPESAGDWLTTVTSGERGVSGIGRVRTPSLIFSGAETGSPRGLSFTMSNVNVNVPQSSSNTINSALSSSSSQSLTVSPVSSLVLSPSSVNVPSSVPSAAPTSVLTPSPSFSVTNIPSNVPSNVPSDVPSFVDVPTFTTGFGGIIPPFGFGRGTKSRRTGGRSRSKRRYTTSLVAEAFNIRGTKSQKRASFLTGIGVRPI